MKCLLGKKIRGFKFKSDNTISYSNEMDKHIGEVGIIKYRLDNYVRVLFEDDNTLFYPLPEALEHLVDSEDSIPELGDGVFMEVSDNKDFSNSRKKLVIGKKFDLFYAWHLDFTPTLETWGYARPINEKIELSMQEIADKFGVNVKDLKIKK